MAFGVLNLSPSQAWLVTFAELNAMVKHKLGYTTRNQRELYQVMDNLNAFNTLMQARCVGSDKGDLDDFKLYREEIEVSEVEKSPEELSNIIKMMAKAGVIKPEGGD